MTKIFYLKEKGSLVGPSDFPGFDVLCAESTTEATKLIKGNRDSIDAFVLGLIVYKTNAHMHFSLDEGARVYDLIDEMGVVGERPIVFYSLMAECLRPQVLYEEPGRIYDPKTPGEDMDLNWFCWDRNGQKILEDHRRKIYVLDSFSKPWEITRLVK